MNPSIVIACVVVGLVVAVVVGALAFFAGMTYRRKTAEAKIGSAEEELDVMLEPDAGLGEEPEGEERCKRRSLVVGYAAAYEEPPVERDLEWVMLPAIAFWDDIEMIAYAKLPAPVRAIAHKQVAILGIAARKAIAFCDPLRLLQHIMASLAIGVSILILLRNASDGNERREVRKQFIAMRLYP